MSSGRFGYDNLKFIVNSAIMFKLPDNKKKIQVINMWNMPAQERLDGIPRLYATENIPANNKLIYLHFFIGECDWYIAEYGGDDIFFGFANLNGDLQNAEWGYSSFSELKEIKIGGWCEVDCELGELWEVKRFGEIEVLY